MSRRKPIRRKPHLSGSFIWQGKISTYKSVRCETCKARHEKRPCESCVETGLDAIPLAEVINDERES